MHNKNRYPQKIYNYLVPGGGTFDLQMRNDVSQK